LDLREEVIGEVTVLEVKGRIDSTTAPTLRERLQGSCAPDGKSVVVDLQHLEYISSAGFRVFLLAAKQADDTAGKLMLCGLSAKVAQLFELGGFEDIFRIVKTRADALDALK
jgi:anti-anti-sigma factor